MHTVLKTTGYITLYSLLLVLSVIFSYFTMGLFAKAISDCSGMNCLGIGFVITLMSIPCGIVLSGIVMLLILIWIEGKPSNIILENDEHKTSQ